MSQKHPLFIYIHIPFCEKRCSYCDFTILKNKKPQDFSYYVSLIKKEIYNKYKFFKKCEVQTLYFGGGTPSLIPPLQLVEIIENLKNHFSFTKTCEITIEINPGTLPPQHLDLYRKGGVNRFSLGVQTFSSEFLKTSNRTHTKEQALKDLALLTKNQLNFSADLMFGIPKQNFSHLEYDLKTLCDFSPSHLSLYNLTVPKKHPLSFQRPTENKQAEMFSFISAFLKKQGFIKYELSNFSKKNFFSRHNSAYWDGSSFLGLGMSAHSYLNPSDFPSSYGVRFWNSKQFKTYASQASSPCSQSPLDCLSPFQIEKLQLHEAVTDFCFTRLRTHRGLSLQELERKFPPFVTSLVKEKLENLLDQNHLKMKSEFVFLSPKGELLSNQIFLELTFTKKDLKFYNKGRLFL